MLALLGMLGVLVPAFGEWHWDHGVIRDIGSALLISAGLGFTIDRWLKTEIASGCFWLCHA